MNAELGELREACPRLYRGRLFASRNSKLGGCRPLKCLGWGAQNFTGWGAQNFTGWGAQNFTGWGAQNFTVGVPRISRLGCPEFHGHPE